ncbi:MAG TPA: prepilin-type N-terminal cleavage/methylation domain-containing protein [Candidatus Paceibacterota bacterium]|nr:prepilin-type N-terminal cleavage/methylation domain-containing protein [Candidatus Paceibacterota bacterium]
MRGFTLAEILVVVAILGLLVAMSLPVFSIFREESRVTTTAEEVASILRLAQNRTLASQGDTKHGVYFDNIASPHQYVLFQTNTDYASRNAPEDEVYEISDKLEFSVIDFAGGQEVVFERLTGATNQAGSVTVRVASDPAKVRTVFVESSGNVEIGSSISPGDDGNCTSDTPPGGRVCDTRHVHIEYGPRVIDTLTETITLRFSSPPDPDITHDIVIASSLSGGQIVWEDDIDVYLEKQHVKIHTHKLNDFGVTEFSIHRASDPIHTKPLLITISGDLPAPNKLIEYDAAGDIVISGTESTSVILPYDIQ